MTSDRDKSYFVRKILHHIFQGDQALFSQPFLVCVWCRTNFCYYQHYFTLLSSLLSTNYLICKTRLVINVTVRHRDPRVAKRYITKNSINLTNHLRIINKERCLATSCWTRDVTLDLDFPSSQSALFSRVELS